MNNALNSRASNGSISSTSNSIAVSTATIMASSVPNSSVACLTSSAVCRPVMAQSNVVIDVTGEETASHPVTGTMCFTSPVTGLDTVQKKTDTPVSAAAAVNTANSSALQRSLASDSVERLVTGSCALTSATSTLTATLPTVSSNSSGTTPVTGAQFPTEAVSGGVSRVSVAANSLKSNISPSSSNSHVAAGDAVTNLGEILELHWMEHKNIFSQSIGALRSTQLYSDVTLACDGQFYPVHKFVLSTCSEFFGAMFEWTPCVNPVLVINNVSTQDLETILDFMYTGEASIRETQLHSVLLAAKCLRVKGLTLQEECKPVVHKPVSIPTHHVVNQNLRSWPFSSQNACDAKGGLKLPPHYAPNVATAPPPIKKIKPEPSEDSDHNSTLHSTQPKPSRTPVSLPSIDSLTSAIADTSLPKSHPAKIAAAAAAARQQQLQAMHHSGALPHSLLQHAAGGTAQQPVQAHVRSSQFGLQQPFLAASSSSTSTAGSSASHSTPSSVSRHLTHLPVVEGKGSPLTSHALVARSVTATSQGTSGAAQIGTAVGVAPNRHLQELLSTPRGSALSNRYSASSPHQQQHMQQQRYEEIQRRQAMVQHHQQQQQLQQQLMQRQQLHRQQQYQQYQQQQKVMLGQQQMLLMGSNNNSNNNNNQQQTLGTKITAGYMQQQRSIDSNTPTGNNNNLSTGNNNILASDTSNETTVLKDKVVSLSLVQPDSHSLVTGVDGGPLTPMEQQIISEIGAAAAVEATGEDKTDQDILDDLVNEDSLYAFHDEDVAGMSGVGEDVVTTAIRQHVSAPSATAAQQGGHTHATTPTAGVQQGGHTHASTHATGLQQGGQTHAATERRSGRPRSSNPNRPLTTGVASQVRKRKRKSVSSADDSVERDSSTADTIRVDECELSQEGGMELIDGSALMDIPIDGQEEEDLLLTLPAADDAMLDHMTPNALDSAEFAEADDQSSSSSAIDPLGAGASSGAKPSRFKCPECPKICLKEETLAKHIESHKNKKYTCGSCNFVAKNFDQLREHRRTHMTKKCPRCNFSTKRADALKKHLANHNGDMRSGDSKTHCKMCDYTSSNSAALRHHVKHHHDHKYTRDGSSGVS